MWVCFVGQSSVSEHTEIKLILKMYSNSCVTDTSSRKKNRARNRKTFDKAVFEYKISNTL